MFTPKTERIREISEYKKETIYELEFLFAGQIRMYIDYANIRPWSEKLGWHIDIKRLKQFLDSFSTIESIYFYNGYLLGNERSEKEKKEVEENNYFLRTKPVKIMTMSIDATSVSTDSSVLLSQFIRWALLKRYDKSTIVYLNEKFTDMNNKGEFVIKDMKCNFDVEIGVDMLLDCERKNADVFVLWSGDSDFYDPIEQLINSGKKVVLFATARKVSRELSQLSKKGLLIFDIQKIRDFICWKKELVRTSKKDSFREPLSNDS